MQHVSDQHYRRPGMGSLTRYAAVFTGWRRLCMLTALLCGVATLAAADTHESGVSPAPVLGDLNGDGRDDVMLRHTDGRWFYYPMDGRSHITDQRGYADLTRNLAWQFAGIGDLNGDGRDDVLMRHTDGRWWYYPMDGRRHITAERGLAGLTRNLDWHVAGIGDLNGDGKDDVLLRNKNGRWYYYPMNGRRYLTDERGYADLTRDLDWQVAGMGDLNGDGKDDVLLRHTDGRWDYYPMDGRNPIADQRGLAGLTRNLAWSVAGIGDLNGDGRDDVLLRHTDSRWYYYPMNGRRFLIDERGYAGLTRNLAWQVAGIGDLNGDGRDDVLLRHTDSRWYYYPMDGRNYLADERGYANLTRNPDWSIAALSTGFAPADQSGDMTDDGDGDIYVPFPSGEGEFSIDDTGGLTWRLGGFTQRIGNAGCIRGDFTFNGVFHDLGTSKWQMRTGPTAAWSDVQGTIETDAICGYDLTAAAPGHQYRTVVEITIGGERKMYSSNIITKNTDQGNPDLVVESPSVSDSAPITGQSFTFGVTVRNQGGGQAAATTLRYYRSTDATISNGDSEVGTDATSALAASGTSDESISLTAPSTAGTYYYGACVDAVSGESDTGNNCSSAVRVTVSDSQMEIESFDLDSDNSDPSGIVFANDKFYMVDWRDDKVYAYHTSWQPDSASDFDLDSDNGRAVGIAFANDRFYVVDSDDGKVYAYQASGQRDSAADFDLSSLNSSPGGITFVNDRFYVVDRADDEAYAYSDSGARIYGGGFDLDPDNGDPVGITFTNDRFYVADSRDEKVYAYQASGQLDSAADFELDSANGSASGIAFANDKFYVVDSTFTAKVYAVSVTISDSQMVTESFDLDPNNSDPSGIAFANDKFYVVDWRDDKVYAYHTSWQPDSASHFNLDPENGSADGITFANDRFYVVDSDDEKVYAYQASGQRDSAADFDLSSLNSSPGGITFVNDRFYVVDYLDDEAYAYSASGARLFSGDFDLDPDNGRAVGITFANDRFYVVDRTDQKVYAYQASGQRDPAADISLYSANSSASGIAFANDRFYVVDSNFTAKVYVVESTHQLSDLVVGSASVSDATPLTEDSIVFTATVRNRGTTASTATTLRYYRSEDRTISSSDSEIGTVAVSALAAATSSEQSISLTAPSTAGTYYYGACIDPVTGESDTANNCSSVVRVTVRARIADLVVESPSVSDSTPTSGDSFTLTANVRNRGTIASTATTLRYYRSEDTSISSSDTEVGTSAVSALAASENSSRTISLSAPSTEGTYYYGACVDPVTGESDTGNNCSSGVRVTVRARIADLVVESPSVSDSTSTSGDSFTLTATVRNRGTIASTATTLRYYRSEDTSISSSDTEVGTSAVSALTASENSSRTINLSAPSTEGTYYYGACVDPVTGESDTGNNCSSGVRVTVRARIADLVVESPSVSDSTSTSGDSFTLTATVRNRGTIASTATTLRYYRSEDTSISSSDTEVGTSAVSALAASENSSRTINLSAPSTEGTYYYGACVDPVSGESNTRNNCSNGVRVIVSQFGTGTFDMGVRNPRPSGITFSNDRFYVVDSSQGKVYVYQASGQRDSASDFDLDSENESPTGITFANGRFYVVDSSQDKVYGYQASGQRDSASDFDLDSDNASARGITFTNDRFYVVDAGDDKVYAYQASGQRDSASDFDLDPDNSRSNGITFSNDRFYVVDWLYNHVYAYQASGQRDSTSDFNPEQGLTRISGIIFTNGGFYAVDFFGNRVYFVTPTPDRPDLAVASPSVSDTTPASGDSFMFTATVRNHGTLASTDTTLRYYRSEDTTISSSDIEVGTDSVSALSVAATNSKTISLPAPSTEGTYYYGACVDPVSGESYTGNNCSTAVVVFGGGPFPAYDLAISRATLHAPTSNVTIGDPIYMSVTVANRGPNRSQPAKLRFDSSTYRDIRALDSGATTTFSRVRVGSVNFGSRTYRACIEEAPGEENTDNNCASRSTPIYTP